MNTTLRNYLAAILVIAPVIWLPTLLSPSMVLLSAPEFLVPLQTWLYLGGVFALSALVLAGLMLLVGPRVKEWFRAVCGAIFLVGFLVIIYFPEGGRRLDGIAAEAQEAGFLMWVYAAYALGVVSVALLLKYFRSSLGWLVNLGFALSVVLVGYVFFNQGAPTEVEYAVDDVDLRLGTDANVIFVIADMLQGSSVEQYLALDPEIAEKMQGFTAYTRATSPFPFTNFGLPAILSGNLYSVEEPTDFQENLQAARENSFITDATAAGFEKSVVGFEQLKIVEDQASYQEVVNPTFIAALLADLGLTRLTKLSGLVAEPSAEDKLLVNLKRESLAVMERWQETSVSEVERKLTVVHNFIPHSPTYYSMANLTQPKLDWRAVEANVPNYFDEMGFFFHKLADVFEHIKSLGKYEDALIIVTGDHGHFIGGRAQLYNTHAGAEDFKGYERGSWARAASMYNPVILIKPPGAQGPAVSSRAAVSVMDLRDLVREFVQTDSLELQRIGHNRDTNVVVTFEDTAANPYQSFAEHVVLEFEGNVAQLPTLFSGSDVLRFPYTTGNTIAPANGLLDGNWSKEAGKGAWLFDYPGHIRLDVADLAPDMDYQLSFEASALVSRLFHPMQRIRVAVNGSDLATVEITQAEVFTVPIPRNVLATPSNEIDVTFTPLDARTPKELRLWDTSTPVSMFLRSFAIETLVVESSYAIGTRLEPANSALVGDWMKERGKGAWLGSRKSEIQLTLADGQMPANLELVLAGSPLLSASHTSQRVRISIGGEVIGTPAFSKDLREAVVAIPPELIPLSGEEYVISVEPLDAASPKELGLWDTEVALSIYLNSVQIRTSS